jgi:hypothetical protein
VTSDTVTVKGTDNTSVIIMLEKTTKYLKDDKPGNKGDLAVGVRVVIEWEVLRLRQWRKHRSAMVDG